MKNKWWRESQKIKNQNKNQQIIFFRLHEKGKITDIDTDDNTYRGNLPE